LVEDTRRKRKIDSKSPEKKPRRGLEGYVSQVPGTAKKKREKA